MIWLCRDKHIEYSKKTLIMAIVNVTPDSFSDGGEHYSAGNAVAYAKQLINQGADIIDIGAQSTRPGHDTVSDTEEWRRISSVIADLRQYTNIPISIDTYYPYVAEKALQAGADIINDVSGSVNKKMAQIVKSYNAGWIIMHSTSGGVYEVKQFFDSAVTEAEALGVDKSSICLDMGIGFNKSYEQSMSLIANVSKYKKHGYPLLLGASRKRVIGRGSAQPDPKKRIFGNIAADTAAILGGADIIRLHDVANEKQGIEFAYNMKGFIL